MKKIKSFFKKLFGSTPKVICMKDEDNMYYRGELIQGRWQSTGAGYKDCQTCKEATGATECI